MNNAGYGGDGLFEQASNADIRAMFETNLFGPMNVMREALPEMRAAGNCAIVNVTLMAGHLCLPGQAVYSASKHALNGLTESLALEYRPLGVRIHSVVPGAYPTTAFGVNTDDRLEAGNAQLIEFTDCGSGPILRKPGHAGRLRFEFPVIRASACLRGQGPSSASMNPRPLGSHPDAKPP